MAKPILYLDHDVHLYFIAALRRHGYEAYSTHECGYREASDEEQLSSGQGNTTKGMMRAVSRSYPGILDCARLTLANHGGIEHNPENFVAGSSCRFLKVCQLVLGQITGISQLKRSSSIFL